MSLALVPLVSSLVAPPTGRSSQSTVLKSTEYAQTLYGVGPETGFWDPLGLSNIGTDGTVDFFRAAEIKHGRVAMMASLGYIHHLAGITFPGKSFKRKTLSWFQC